MTPAEHLAEAEQILTGISSPDGQMQNSEVFARAMWAAAHALIAAAAELGVPHNEGTAGGGPGAAQASTT